MGTGVLALVQKGMEKMKKFLDKYFDGAPLWGVILICGAWAAMFLALIAKL